MFTPSSIDMFFILCTIKELRDMVGIIEDFASCAGLRCNEVTAFDSCDQLCHCWDMFNVYTGVLCGWYFY